MDAKSFLNRFNNKLDLKNDLNGSLILRSDKKNKSFSNEDKRAKWSNVILNTIIEIGKEEGKRVCPNIIYYSEDERGQGHNSSYDKPQRNNDEPEYLVDVSWMTLTKNSKWWVDILKEENSSILTLICECEWGWLEGKDLDYHINLIMDDFAKILDVRAELKIFISSYGRGFKKDALMELLESTWKAWKRKINDNAEMVLMLWDYDENWQNRKAGFMKTI